MRKKAMLDRVMDIKKYVEDLNNLVWDLEKDVKKIALNADIAASINKSCDGINYNIDRISFAADQIGNSIGHWGLQLK